MWTSSAGSTCLLWDKSQENPVTKLLHHWYQLTAVHWCSQEENKELVVLGDEIGNLLTVDTRAPNKILNSTHVSELAISELSFNGSSKFGVISNNFVKVVEASNNSKKCKVLKDHSANEILYSMCWDQKDKNKFYVVGDHKTAFELYL
jgi:WD40 repeat protein